MVEINNQRERSSICWRGRRELITDVRKRNMVNVIVGGKLLHSYSESPSQTATLNPKLKSTGAGRYQLLFPLVGCLPPNMA